MTQTQPNEPRSAQRIELIGFLGRDPEIRQTEEKTFTLRPDQRPQDHLKFDYGPRPPVADPPQDLLIEADAEIEITRPGRDYAVLSLAVHDGERTLWHQLRAFNIDPDHPLSRYRQLFGVRIARKGDQVQVTGRPAVWTTPDGAEFHFIEILDLRILRLKRGDRS